MKRSSGASNSSSSSHAVGWRARRQRPCEVHFPPGPPGQGPRKLAPPKIRGGAGRRRGIDLAQSCTAVLQSPFWPAATARVRNVVSSLLPVSLIPTTHPRPRRSKQSMLSRTVLARGPIFEAGSLATAGRFWKVIAAKSGGMRRPGTEGTRFRVCQIAGNHSLLYCLTSRLQNTRIIRSSHPGYGRMTEKHRRLRCGRIASLAFESLGCDSWARKLNKAGCEPGDSWRV